MSNKNKYYDQYVVPKDVDLPITIYGSGSSGNSILFEPARLLVDLGLPFTHYPDGAFYKISYIALTHEHGDHLNEATLFRVLNEFPWIQMFASPHLIKFIDQLMEKRGLNPKDFRQRIHPLREVPFEIDVKQTGHSFTIMDYVTHHGSIPNVAYDIRFDELGPYHNARLLYASDLDTMFPTPDDEVKSMGLPQALTEQFDILCVEANYDMNVVLDILAKDPGDAKAKGNLRHLSEQTAFDYVHKHLTPNGTYIPLHASSTFGSFLQNQSTPQTA